MNNIKQLSTALLDQEIHFSKIQENINAIHESFKNLSPVSGTEEDMKSMAAVPTANGMALGLTHAAQCLLDYNRTAKLLRGMISAIKDLQQKSPNETINVFYAGCGPYAPFITLVAPLFTPEEVQFSLLEINNDSMESAKTLINNLGLSQFVKETFVEDAVTFEIPNATSYQILFSETLDAMLYRESYVPILMNMLKQLNDDVIVIPENVYLTVDIYNNVDSDKPALSKEIFNTRKAIYSDHDQEKFAPTIIDLKPDYQGFFIDTTVVVYQDIVITPNESSLTIPAKFFFPTPLEHKKAIFTYFIKPNVELKLDYDEEIKIEPIPQDTNKEYVSSDRIKLPFTFNVEKLKAEFEALKLENFEYYNVIPLRAPAHEVDKSLPFPPPAGDYADGSWTDWLDTKSLEKSPYLNEVIDTFKAHTTVNLVRLLRLAPDATVQQHTDPTLALEEEKSMIRLTVPISNPNEEFYLNGEIVDLKPGECWYLRLSDPHKVVNKGSEERVNITIDMIPNDWIKNIIVESDKN